MQCGIGVHMHIDFSSIDSMYSIRYPWEDFKEFVLLSFEFRHTHTHTNAIETMMQANSISVHGFLSCRLCFIRFSSIEAYL